MADTHNRGGHHLQPHDENELSVLRPATTKVVLNKKTFFREVHVSDHQYELQTLHTNTGSSVVPTAATTTQLSLPVNGLRVPKPLHLKDYASPPALTGKKRPLDPISTFDTVEEGPTTDLLRPFIPITVRNDKLLPDGESLDLSSLANELPTSVDFPPFLHLEEYEKPLDRDDYEGLCLAALQDEFMRIATGEGPVFDRQLEIEEKEGQLSFLEYPLYYLFGVDRTGYFELKEERDRFQSCPWSRFANIKKQSETTNSESESALTSASIESSLEFLS